MSVRLLTVLLVTLFGFGPPGAAEAMPKDVGDGTYTAGPGWNVSGIVPGRFTWAGALAADLSTWDVPDAVPFCLQSGPIAPTGRISQQGVIDDPP